MSETSGQPVIVKRTKVIRRHGGASFGWFLGFLGAAVYYIQQADGFWAGVLGLLKALVWPAFLVYSLLKHVAA